MITLITGKKGSGKTKKLIELTNNTVETSKGYVVVIEKGQKLTYDISHKARLIDTELFNILGTTSLYGFICGICAANYDVTDILIDSALKICKEDLSALSDLIKNLNVISEKTNTKFVFSISADSKDISDNLSSICEII